MRIRTYSYRGTYRTGADVMYVTLGHMFRAKYNGAAYYYSKYDNSTCYMRIDKI
jgi:hypothetical protein